jgi:hypothetical protein
MTMEQRQQKQAYERMAEEKRQRVVVDQLQMMLTLMMMMSVSMDVSNWQCLHR